MSNIATHFEMLMPREEQERIGATPDRDEGMRVMRVLHHYSEMQAQLAELRPRALPAEMTPAIADVLEMLPMQTCPIGRGFRQYKGATIPPKMEKEHAYVIWWLLGHALKHGDDWRKHAALELPIPPSPEVAQSQAG